MIESRYVCDRCKRDSFEGNTIVKRNAGPEAHLCPGCASEFNEWLKTRPKYNLSFATAIMEMVIKKRECENEFGDIFRYNYDVDEIQYFDRCTAPPDWIKTEIEDRAQEVMWRVVESLPKKAPQATNKNPSRKVDWRIKDDRA